MGLQLYNSFQSQRKEMSIYSFYAVLVTLVLSSTGVWFQ